MGDGSLGSPQKRFDETFRAAEALKEHFFPEVEVRKLYESLRYMESLGVVRLEEWPEGLVLWVGGEIVWKSWARCKEGKQDG